MSLQWTVVSWTGWDKLSSYSCFWFCVIVCVYWSTACLGAANCSQNNGGCAHNCSMSNSLHRIECSCRPGYKLLDNQLDCVGMLHSLLIVVVLPTSSCLCRHQ